MPILSVDGLVKTYSRRRVVDGVSLEVYPGELVGLLGPNGAGKTTTFRMICGMVRPDSGTVELSGEEVTTLPMYQRARHGGMGYLPQQSSVFGKLSAEDNLYGMMQMLGFSWRQQRDRCNELLEQFKIDHIRKTKAGRLSGGERRRLEIARCLISDPKIIMLDEPFAGIDPVTVQNIQVIIRELSANGIAILITDHAAREILEIADRTYVLSEGKILVSGSREQIVENDQVRSKYLGDIKIAKSRNVEPVQQTSSSMQPNASAQLTELRPPGTVSNRARELNQTATSATDSQQYESTQNDGDSQKASEVVNPQTPSQKKRRKPITSPFRSTDLD